MTHALFNSAVFVVATSYPLIAITARNNVQQILESSFKRSLNGLAMRILLSLGVSLPPLLIAVASADVGILISFTGLFCGVFIQYVIPAVLVWYARRRHREMTDAANPHRSPFAHRAWVWFILVFSASSLITVIAYKIMSTANGDGGEDGTAGLDGDALRRHRRRFLHWMKSR